MASVQPFGSPMTCKGREGRSRKASHLLQPCLRPAHAGTTRELRARLDLTHQVLWQW